MHNDTWFKGGKDYIYAIKDFIDKAQELKVNRDLIGANNNGVINRGNSYNANNQGMQN